MKRPGPHGLIACLLVWGLLAGCMGPPRRSASPSPQREQLQQVQAQLQEVTVSLEALGRRFDELDTRTNALADELTRARRASPLAPLELDPLPPTSERQPAAEPMRDFEVASLALGMLTGAADWDGQPGDDGIIVYLYPLDQSGDTVKRAGDCTFELFDLNRSERPLIMTWHIPAAQAAESWQTFPGCYRFKLAWRGSAPTTTEPILKIAFVVLSGREFTATKRLRVVLPPAAEEAQ